MWDGKLLYSQKTVQNTKTVYKGIPDSILVPYKFVVISNKAFEQLRGYKEVHKSMQETLHYKDIQLQYVTNQVNYLKKADSFCIWENYIIKQKSAVNDSLYIGASNELVGVKADLRRNKVAKVASVITIPISFILGIVLGYYLH